MKKILLVVLSVLLVILWFKVPTQASSQDSINLISPSTFPTYDAKSAYLGQYAKLGLSESEFIPITSGIEYFFLPTYINKLTGLPYEDWSEMPLFDGAPTIKLYNENEELINTVVLSKELKSETIVAGYAFSVPTGVSKIKFQAMELTSTLLNAASFWHYVDEQGRLDTLLLLIEADKIKYLPTTAAFNYNDIRGMATYDITDLYLGEDLDVYQYGNTYFDNLSPVINSNQYSYRTSVDNPISLEGLKNALRISAYDEIDGNITSSITITAPLYLSKVYNVPNVKNRILGDYVVEFSVSDQAGNIATMSVEISVEDTERPTLNVASSTLNYQNEVTSPLITLESILANIVVEDNFSNVAVVETHNDYTGHENELGIYIIEFIYEDSSENRLTVTVTIVNIDTIAPVISSSKDSLSISYTSKDTLSTLLNSLNIMVVDSHEGTLSYSIVADEYTANSRYVGIYNVKIRAEDSSGNDSEKTIKIEVIDDVLPQFYLDNNLVIIKVGASFNEADIINLLKLRNLSQNNDFTIEIISDEYTPNRNTIGEYTMKLNINYHNGAHQEQTLIFRVEGNSAVKPLSFLGKVWHIIKKIFLWLWNIIKWPFEQLIALF